MAVATNSLAAWMLASRPKTLGAIACPILIGSAKAWVDNNFSVMDFFLTLLAGLLLQILANFVNDYGDFIKGTDTKERLGPPRAMQMGWITYGAMRAGIISVIFLASFVGLFLVAKAGIFVLAAGIFSIALCLWYTLGPKPLAYIGFAEIIIFLVFGPLATLGSYYVQTLSVSNDLFWLSLSPGFFSAALLLTNNLRDMNSDERARKMTTAVRFGDRATRVLVFVLLLFTLSGPIALVAFYHYSPLILLSACALILPLRYFSILVNEPITARFNLLFVSIGQALFVFGLLSSIGIIYGVA